MPIRAIAYISEAAPGLTHDAAVAMVRKAATFNIQAGVTGVLLYDGARFFQYIEGPEDGLSGVYGRILNSKAHVSVVELGRATTGSRYFPYWAMRMLSADADQISTIVDGAWESFAIRSVVEDGERHSGVEELSRVVLSNLKGAGGASGHRP